MFANPTHNIHERNEQIVDNDALVVGVEMTEFSV